MRIKKEDELIKILMTIRNIPIKINWEEIIDFQEINFKKGINKVSIAGLIIVQNVRDNDLALYSLDKHFELMNKHIKFNKWKFNN